MEKKQEETDVEKSIKSISSVILARASLQRGIKVEHLNPGQEKMAFLELSYKGHREYIVGQKTSAISTTANYAVYNKSLTKNLLLRENLSVPAGRLFSKRDSRQAIDEYAAHLGYPLVIKKYNGTHGDLVFTGIRDQMACDHAIDLILREDDCFLMESMFIGEEHRMIATRKKFIAAAIRRPANICGDGVHSIRELVRIKNSDPARGERFLMETPLKKIKIDDVVKQHLYGQGLDLSFVPSRGENILLRKNSNLSTGGESIDVTDRVHPELKRIAIAAIRAIPGLAYGGVDLMSSQDISKKPNRKSYVIIEINSSPGIFLHHFPFQGKPRDVAGAIIDLLFPETKK